MDILAADLARGVLGSAVVGVVVDQLAEAGRQEVEDLQRAVGVDMADAGHVVDLLARGQVPAQRGGGRPGGRTGHRGPCGAGKDYLLKGRIDKVQAGMKFFTENCRGGAKKKKKKRGEKKGF